MAEAGLAAGYQTLNSGEIGQMPDRVELLRHGVERTDRILEVGPSFNPLLPKREGWMVFSADHSDRDGLIRKYCNDPSVDVSKIEPVDFVWASGALSDSVPIQHHGTFDVILASHVIEHIPDLASFFHSAELLTKQDGRTILAVPDKRVCFDFFRPLSTTGDVLTARHERRSRHSRKSLWDYSAYQVTKHGGPGWGRDDQAPMVFTYSVAQTAALNERCDSGDYVDAHAWTFVPSSFALIMLELACLGLTDWQIERIEAAEYTEFYVWLRRGARAEIATMSEADLAAERLRLLMATMLDLDDQGRQLTASRANRLQDALLAEREAACRRAEVTAQLTESLNDRAGRHQELEVELSRVQAELAHAQGALCATRLSRAWRARSALRKLLRLPPTPADA